MVFFGLLMIKSEFCGAENSESTEQRWDSKLENTDNRSDLTLPALLLWMIVP